MYSRPPVVALRETLASFVTAGPEGRTAPQEAQLTAQVCAVVDDLKSEGWPPERVVLAIKQIASDAGLRPSKSIVIVAQPLSGGDGLLVDLVRWSIDQYYYRGALPSR